MSTSDQPSLFEEGAPRPERRIVHVKWAEAAGARYIGRPGPFGNPFALENATDALARDAVIQQYREWFADRIERDEEFRRAVNALKGQTLSCWCPTRKDLWRACHGDVILEWLDNYS
jgi:hypothetical protein